MRLSTVLLAHAGLAAGFVAARQLLAADDARLQALPQGVRAPLRAARSRFERARARTAEGLTEGAREVEAAQTSLHQEYLQRSGRQGTG